MLPTDPKAWKRSGLPLALYIWAAFGVLFVVLMSGGLALFHLGIPLLGIEGLQQRMYRVGLEKINDMADLKKELLVQWVHERVVDLHMYAHPSGTLTQWVQRPKTPVEAKALKAWVSEVRESHPSYSDVFVVRFPEGTVLASGNGDAESLGLSQAPPRAGQTEIFRLLPLKTPNSNRTILWGRKLATDGSHWILLVINPRQTIESLLQDRLGLGNSGEILLLDQNQHSLFPGQLANRLSGSATGTPDDRLLIDLDLKKGHEGVTETVDYRGQRVLAAFRQVRIRPGVTWGLVVKLDVSELNQPIRQATLYSMAIALLAMALFAWMSRWIARWISRPLFRLSHVAERVRQGDFSQMAELEGGRELVQLASTFNGMVSQIKQSKENLTAMVEHRTEALTRTNRLLGQMELVGSIGAWEYDLKYEYLVFTEGTQRVFGIDQSPLPEEALSFFSDLSQKKITQEFRRVITERTLGDMELPFTNAEGRQRVVHVVANPVVVDGRVRKVTGLIQDITERAQAKSLLEEERNQAHQYLAIAEVVIAKLDPKGRVLLLNPKGYELLGYAEEEVLGKSWFDQFILPEERQEAKEIFKRTLKGEPQEVLRFENQVRTRSGELKTFVWHNAQDLDHQGRVQGVLSSGHDISDIREREQHLLYLRTAIDNLSDALFIVDASGQVLFSNPAYHKLKAHIPTEFLANKGPAEYLETDIQKALQEQGFWKGELSGVKPEEKTICFQMTISLIPGSSSWEESRFACVAIDITQEKNRQSQMTQIQKMESLGVLAGGVAHEINNPVGYVTSNLRSLQEYMEQFDQIERLYERLEQVLEHSEDPPKLLATIQKKKEEIQYEYLRQDLPNLIGDMDEGLRRIRDIVLNLREVSHQDTQKTEMVDLNKLIKQSVKVAWNALKYKCEVQEELGDIPLVPCRRQAIQQVLLNLIINASQAITEKGQVVLRSRVRGDRLQIEVEDDGAGIEDKDLGRIFEPFFTTKEVGHGTGLGLAISYKLVQEHQGTLEVRSQPGQGTCFTLSLPLA